MHIQLPRSKVSPDRHSTTVINLSLIGLLSFVFFMVWVSTKPEQIFWSLDEAGKYINLQSMLQTGRINTPLVYPGQNFDPDHKFIPLYYSIQRENYTYSWWPVNLPLATLPLYLLLGWPGLFVLPAAAGAITAVISGIIAWKITASQKAAYLACLLTALTTPITFYSTMYWEHTIAAAFCIAALALILIGLPGKRHTPAIFAGILASLSIFFRLDTTPLLIGFGIPLLYKHRKQAIVYALSTAFFSLPWMALNRWVCGHPLGPTFANIETSQPFIGLRQAGLKFIPFALFNPPRVDGFIFSRPLLLLASSLLLIAVVSFFFRRTKWITLLSIAGITSISAWVLFQPAQYLAVHGFLLIAPHILFAFFLVEQKQNWNNHLFPWLLSSALIIYVLVYIRFGWVAAGGLQWGPRYLLSIYPLLIIAAVLAVKTMWTSYEKRLKFAVLVVFFFGCLVGLGFQIRGITTTRSLTELHAIGTNSLLSINDAPVVASEVYVMNNSVLYWTGNFFKIPASEEEWTIWNDLVRRNGFEYYYVVDAFSVNNSPVNEIAQRLLEHPSGYALRKEYITP